MNDVTSDRCVNGNHRKGYTQSHKSWLVHIEFIIGGRRLRNVAPLSIPLISLEINWVNEFDIQLKETSDFVQDCLELLVQFCHIWHETLFLVFVIRIGVGDHILRYLSRALRPDIDWRGWVNWSMVRSPGGGCIGCSEREVGLGSVRVCVSSTEVERFSLKWGAPVEGAGLYCDCRSGGRTTIGVVCFFRW